MLAPISSRRHSEFALEHFRKVEHIGIPAGGSRFSGAISPLCDQLACLAQPQIHNKFLRRNAFALLENGTEIATAESQIICDSLHAQIADIVCFHIIFCAQDVITQISLLLTTGLQQAGKQLVHLAAHKKLPRGMSAEAGSRAYLTLAADQLALAEKLLALGKKTVLLLYSGRPLELGTLADRVDAIWEVWFPGTEGGNAIADLLLGETEPTARLAISFPHTVGQLPLYYNALPTGRPDVGQERYASRYIDSPHDAAFPFGFGLSYTTFAYSPVSLSAQHMGAGDVLTACVSVKNTGTRGGSELVQLYLRDLAGSYARPVKMLKGFRRIFLQPGEEKPVSFRIDTEMLSYYTKDQGYTAEPGDFIAFIGSDSSVDSGARFTLN